MATTEHPTITDTHVEQDAPGTDLAHLDPAANPVRSGLVVRSMDDLASMASAVALSRMFKGTDTVEKAATKMMFAMAMGFDPMAGLTGIDIIEGNPTPNGHFWAAALESHPRYDYEVRETSSERCTITFLRDGVERGTLTWTMEDAQRAGLAGKDNWRKYPRPMLYNRCMTEGARMFCPQLFAGIRAYDPEEMEGISPASSGPWRQAAESSGAPSSAEQVRTITEYRADDGSRWFEVKFRGLPKADHNETTRAVRGIAGAVADADAKVWRVPDNATTRPVLVGPANGETFAEAFGFDLVELADAGDVIDHEDTPAAPVVEPPPTPPPADPAPVVEPDEVIEPETNLLGEPVATEQALATPAAGVPADCPGGTGECDDETAALRLTWLQTTVSDYARFEAILDGAGARVYSDLADAVRWRRVLAAMGYNAG